MVMFDVMSERDATAYGDEVKIALYMNEKTWPPGLWENRWTGKYVFCNYPVHGFLEWFTEHRVSTSESW